MGGGTQPVESYVVLWTELSTLDNNPDKLPGAHFTKYSFT